MRTRAQRRHFTQRRKMAVMRRAKALFGWEAFESYLEQPVPKFKWRRALEGEWLPYHTDERYKDPVGRMIGMMAETRHWCRVYGCHPHRSDMYGPRPSDLRRAPLQDQGDMLLNLR